MKNYISISDVKARTIRRISTGQPELDWLYGASKFGSEDAFTYSWGMPVGTISTWVGEGGVGKSRLAIDIAKAKVLDGSTVLYFQNEVDLPTLASWVNNSQLKNFYCSEVTSLAKQIEAVSQVRPALVFVDSINLVDEFGCGTARSVKLIIDAFREVIRGTDCHVVILCQLNAAGRATGSTALTHLPDTNLTLTNFEGNFKVAIGKKNRYGPKGSEYFGIWKHTDTGVECISNRRLGEVPLTNEVLVSLPPLPEVSVSLPPFPMPPLSLVPDKAFGDFGVRKQREVYPTPVIKLSDRDGKIEMSPGVRDALKTINKEPSFLQKMLRDTFSFFPKG